MALTNNEKQIRHKKLEELKKYGNDVLLYLIMRNDMSFSNYGKKSNEEIQEEINSIINLPNGWTPEDYNSALKKLDNIKNRLYDNPHLMNNDINGGHDFYAPNYNTMDIRKAEWKAPEVVRNIKSILKLSELNKSDQIAVIAEVMRQLAKEILDEKTVPKTFANATALSLIGHQYDKPQWTWETLAQNLFVQNGAEKADEIAKALKNPKVRNKGGLA